MNRTLLAVALTLTWGLAAASADDGKDSPPPAALTAAPPPAMEDAGVATRSSNDSKTARDGRGDSAPDVSIRTQGDDTIEEYRSSGRISMIRITGKGGVVQTYVDTDGDGRLEGNPKDGPIAPVYYKLYEWN